jgi:hypothetical protein
MSTWEGGIALRWLWSPKKGPNLHSAAHKLWDPGQVPSSPQDSAPSVKWGWQDLHERVVRRTEMMCAPHSA